jgi:hypothetical protein
VYRTIKVDHALDQMNEERDHVLIQISLVKDAEVIDLPRLDTLAHELRALNKRIGAYRVAYA